MAEEVYSEDRKQNGGKNETKWRINQNGGFSLSLARTLFAVFLISDMASSSSCFISEKKNF